MSANSNAIALTREELTSPPRGITSIMDALDKYRRARAKLTEHRITYEIVKEVTNDEEKVKCLQVFCDGIYIYEYKKVIAKILPCYSLIIEGEYIKIS